MIALAGIAATAALLLTVSAADRELGLPTCIAGVATMVTVCIVTLTLPLSTIRGVSWTVLPLVAGLFVLVEALARTGVIAQLVRALRNAAEQSPAVAAGASGTILAVRSNLMNNLPAGLDRQHGDPAGAPATARDRCAADRLDLGLNLSITGSLATILWLTAIRREGQEVGFWRFLKVGAVVMPPTLLLALGVHLSRITSYPAPRDDRRMRFRDPSCR